MEYTITASNARPSTCITTEGAFDVDVVVTVDLADLAAGRRAHRTVWGPMILLTPEVQQEAADAVEALPPLDTSDAEAAIAAVTAPAKQAQSALFAAWPIGPGQTPRPFPSDLYATYSAAAQRVNVAHAALESRKRAAIHALMDLKSRN